jgi:hypothetical protein
MYYIGLDDHKKTISYCVKDAAGCVHQEGKMRRLPGPADDRPGDGGDSRGSLRIVSGLAENPNSIFLRRLPGARGSKWMSGSAECRNQPPRGKRAQWQLLIGLTMRSPERERRARAFLLTKTYMDVSGSLLPFGMPRRSEVLASHFAGQVLRGAHRERQDGHGGVLPTGTREAGTVDDE